MAALWVVGCHAATAIMAPNLEVPANYRKWPAFVLNVDRATTNPTSPPQVRDIYINPSGTAVQKGEAFPDGTELVMDIFAAHMGSDGKPVLDSNSQPIKGELLKIFIMGKELGWGAYSPDGLRTGDWLYFAYKGDGTTQIKDSTSPCVSCHMNLSADVDWIYHYADYFDAR